MIIWCKNILNKTCGTTLWIHCHHFELQSGTWRGCSDLLMPPFMLAVLTLTNRTITHICWCTLLIGVNLTSCATQLLESLRSASLLVLTSPSIPGLMCRFCLSGYPYHSGGYYSGYYDALCKSNDITKETHAASKNEPWVENLTWKFRLRTQKFPFSNGMHHGPEHCCHINSVE